MLSSSLRLPGFIVSRVCAVTLALGATAAFAQEPAKERPVLAPHRAIYDLSLLKTRGSASAPASATGRIAYDFTGSACEGFTVAFRQLTELTPSEGETRSSDMRSTTFEAGDHSSLRFRVETTQGSGGSRLLEGAATRSGDGALSLDLRRPKPMKADLDHDAVFPTDMMIRAIEAARVGDSTVSLKVFDGSDTGDKVYQTLSVIGRPSTETRADSTKDQAAMKGMRRWPVTVSYFDLAKVDEPPVYILSFQMWENGVSSDLVLDYGDFQLKGEMTTLQMLPKGECRK